MMSEGAAKLAEELQNDFLKFRIQSKNKIGESRRVPEHSTEVVVEDQKAPPA